VEGIAIAQRNGDDAVKSFALGQQLQGESVVRDLKPNSRNDPGQANSRSGDRQHLHHRAAHGGTKPSWWVR